MLLRNVPLTEKMYLLHLLDSMYNHTTLCIYTYIIDIKTVLNIASCCPSSLTAISNFYR